MTGLDDCRALLAEWLDGGHTANLRERTERFLAATDPGAAPSEYEYEQEARAWFREDPSLHFAHLADGQQPAVDYAAAIVRAALAAAPTVPAGRDLTAQDVRDAHAAWFAESFREGQTHSAFAAEFLNRIARPSNTAEQLVVGKAGVPIDAYDAIQLLAARPDHASQLLAEKARAVADWWNDPPGVLDRDPVEEAAPALAAALWDLLGGGPGDVSDVRPAGSVSPDDAPTTTETVTQYVVMATRPNGEPQQIAHADRERAHEIAESFDPPEGWGPAWVECIRTVSTTTRTTAWKADDRG